LLAAIRDLGFFSLEPVNVEGARIAPRDVAIAVMDPKLRKQNSPDLVALRVVVEGEKGGKQVRYEWELVDRYDAEHGITSMMRTTGYSLSITGQMQAAGEIPVAGVYTPDECVPAEKYLAALEARGVRVVEKN
jgi:lysine 6-dehydrogenase